jgi:hypothetical protein
MHPCVARTLCAENLRVIVHRAMLNWSWKYNYSRDRERTRLALYYILLNIHAVSIEYIIPRYIEYLV